jgi:hypothetical protein
MILAQFFGPFGHSGPSRPTGSSSSYGSASPPIVKWRRHPSTSSAPHFPSPLFLLRAKMGTINGRRLTSHRSSTSRPLRPYKRGATPPANSTVLILSPLSSPPLPERRRRAPLPTAASPPLGSLRLPLASRASAASHRAPEQ